jgi:DNA-binding phage protein
MVRSKTRWTRLSKNEVDIMSKKSAFDRYVDEQKKNPDFAAEYERAGVEIRAIDDFVRRVDTARIEKGMSKADLARKVSTTPEAMRRLLTSRDANPTFQTILSVLEAVGLRFNVTDAPPARPSGLKHSGPKHSGRSASSRPVRKIA